MERYPFSDEQRCHAAIEYQTLRDEILKRVDIRHQTISISLTIAGAFLGVGLTNPSVALIYPLIAAFLATGWAQNDIRIRQIGQYIREELEVKLDGMRWEDYCRQKSVETRLGGFSLVVLSPSGTFILTQLIALLVGCANFSGMLLDWLLLVFGGISIIYVVILSRKVQANLFKFQR
jgi:hypothetical protein